MLDPMRYAAPAQTFAAGLGRVVDEDAREAAAPVGWQTVVAMQEHELVAPMNLQGDGLGGTRWQRIA